MKYEVKLHINEVINRVTTLFTDTDQMRHWELNLLRVDQTKGTLFDTGSEGYLVYQNKDQEMKMKVYVEANQLPQQISIIYEMPGVWNRCINTFSEENGVTLWEMDVEFRFKKINDIPSNLFIEQTKHGMNQFKQFIEVNNEKN